jgi:hypothetical protein
MDITGISDSRYLARPFQTTAYEQTPDIGYQGGAAGPQAVGDMPSTGPLPGSNRPGDGSVWLEQGHEKAYQDKVHVTESGRSRMARLEGQWEVQSWHVRRLRDDLNSLERQAAAGAMRLRSAITSLTDLKGRMGDSGRNVDIYA